MCIIFLNTTLIHDIKLILAFNRDESKIRPTTPAHYWTESDCYGGKDASPSGVRDGTWLGVSGSGRVAALLNVHHKGKGIVYSADRSPRGGLVPGFIKSTDSAEQYVERMKGGNFNYFNLVMGEFKDSTPRLSIYDFYQEKLLTLPLGVHCFGNLPPGFSNNRAQYGETVFSDLLKRFSHQHFSDSTSRDQNLIDQLFIMLSDKTDIPVGEGLAGSFRHVFNEGYLIQDGTLESGSVSSTVLIVDIMNNCHFIERTNFNLTESGNKTVAFSWVIE
ncbi:hypothetical protein ACHWQZ_G010316 [Mnemiopsis leidyi]